MLVMASRGLLISWEMELARRPTAASFSDWTSALSAFFWAVISWTTAATVSTTPSGLRMGE